MGTSLQLIGFDARENVHTFNNSWDTHKREQFLLRSNITKPLSVDTCVWPGVFSENQFDSDSISQCSTTMGKYIPFWDSTTDLKNLIDDYQIEPGHFKLIAVFRQSLDVVPLHSVTPDISNLGFQFAGCDIADDGYTSGLMGCGYDSEERKELLQRYGKAINEWHLFSSADIASEYALLSNGRVPEHAPFYVYHLFVQDLPTVVRSK